MTNIHGQCRGRDPAAEAATEQISEEVFSSLGETRSVIVADQKAPVAVSALLPLPFSWALRTFCLCGNVL